MPTQLAMRRGVRRSALLTITRQRKRSRTLFRAAACRIRVRKACAAHASCTAVYCNPDERQEMTRMIIRK